MSTKATTWAYKQTGLKSGPKFVLVTIADMADQEHSCYPGIPMLSELTCMGETAVRTAIALLVERDLVTIERRHRANGSRTSNRYYLPVDNYEPKPESDARKNGDQSRIPASPKPESEGDINHQINQLTQSTTEVTTEPVDNSAAADAGTDHSSWWERRRDHRSTRRLTKTLDVDVLHESVSPLFDDFDRPRHIVLMTAYAILGKAVKAGTVVLDPTAYVATSIKAEPEIYRQAAFNLEGPNA